MGKDRWLKRSLVSEQAFEEKPFQRAFRKDLALRRSFMQAAGLQYARPRQSFHGQGPGTLKGPVSLPSNTCGGYRVTVLFILSPHPSRSPAAPPAFVAWTWLFPPLFRSRHSAVGVASARIAFCLIGDA